MREIQIQFSKPGNWREFTLTAIYQDSDGYTRIDRYKQNDIPSGQAPALSAAVAVIADMEEDGQGWEIPLFSIIPQETMRPLSFVKQFY